MHCPDILGREHQPSRQPIIRTRLATAFDVEQARAGQDEPGPVAAGGAAGDQHIDRGAHREGADSDLTRRHALRLGVLNETSLL